MFSIYLEISTIWRKNLPGSVMEIKKQNKTCFMLHKSSLTIEEKYIVKAEITFRRICVVYLLVLVDTIVHMLEWFSFSECLFQRLAVPGNPVAACWAPTQTRKGESFNIYYSSQKKNTEEQNRS